MYTSQMPLRNIFAIIALLSSALSARAESVYVRVSQAGYETGNGPFRAYLMSKTGVSSTTFKVINSAGQTVFTAAIGAQLGAWSNSATLTYNVYALDFTVPGGDTYTIAIPGHAAATSPVFAVNAPAVLYPGLLLNSKFFYQTERDGPNYIPNVLRTAPGHLNDQSATVYQTPPLDSDDNIATTGTPLTPTGQTIDASGGWWDAGDYMKYVETISYTVALQEIGVRDFPNQMGANAPHNPPTPPGSISYAGNAAGPPSSPDFTAEAEFGIRFLLKMWDDKSRTLYYQVGNSQDWDNFSYLSDYDIWRLPEADDTWDNCNANATFICHRPVFVAGPAGSPISPNLAGRLTADFALCYQLNRTSNPNLANQCLQSAEDIFALANTSYAEPAPSVDGGTCTNGCLLTIIPFDGYGETVWSDDMELGATELYLALQSAGKPANLPSGLPQTNPMFYLKQAAQFAKNYIANVYNIGGADTLNLYDVSGLAHFELFRAIRLAGNPSGLAITQSAIKNQFLQQVNDAITQAGTDAWGFGDPWNGDTTSHGAGISVMAAQAHYLTGTQSYDTYSQRWLANILGANPWGSSFIVGNGSTFPNCIQHQVANLAGALNGTTGGTPVLWGAASEGPAFGATSGLVGGMIKCPADGGNPFKIFDGNDGTYNPGNPAVYKDNVQSYSTTEPAIDLTSTSFLMWSWRLAGHPNGWLP
jgi:endoglucanase